MIIVRKTLKFIHITKTAGTTIENIGREAGIEWGKYHEEYGNYHYPFVEKSEELKRKYNWFVVVRNPYTRIISEFHSKFGGVGNKADKYTIKGFNKKVRKFINKRNNKREHYMPQYLYLEKYVYVLKFENLKEEFENLMNRHGLNLRLSRHDNKSNVKFNVVDFDKSTIDLIKNVYYVDF
jgi:hypothetical protein